MKLSTLTFVVFLVTGSAAIANSNQFGDGSLENTYIAKKTISANHLQHKLVPLVSDHNNFNDDSFEKTYVVHTVTNVPTSITSRNQYNPLYESRNIFGNKSPP